MSNRALGIEYTKDWIKIVEAASGRKLKVSNFAIVDLRKTEPERHAEQLNHTLQVRGFDARDAIVAVTGGNAEHRLLTLPPLTGRELHFVMERESKKLASGGAAQMLWSYDVLKTKEELGIQKNQILLVAAQRDVVTDVQSFISQTRLKLAQVTTIPEAVLTLARQVTAWKKDAVRTVVYFAGNTVYVLFVQEGVLLLSREIRFEYGNIAQEEQVERLIVELKRSALYFHQNFPQTQRDQILFSGDSDLLGILSARSPQDLGMPGSIFGIEESLDTTGFRGNWDEFRFHLPALAGALGAAWRKRAAGINLLPGKTQQIKGRGANPTRIAAIGCAAACGLAVIAGVHYARQASDISAEKRELTRRLDIANPKLEQAGDSQKKRAAAGDKSSFLHRFGNRADWGEIFRSLSFLVPRSALFESIQIDGGEKAVLILRGFVLSDTAAQGNADFNRFFNEVRGLPFFKTVSMPKPLNVSFDDETRTATSMPAPALFRPRSKTSFEIQCELP